MLIPSRVRLIFTLTMAGVSAHAADCCQNSVAVVQSLSGAASLQAPGSRNRTALFRWQWLPAGSTIEVGAKSNAIVILLNGHRFELGPGAKAEVGAESLARTRGPVQQLQPLPPIPKASPIAGRPPQIAGASRIRGGEVRGLYPRDGAALLPASAKLSFLPVAGASGYRVELVDEPGNVLLNRRTKATETEVPDGMLQAGKRYAWLVEALGPEGAIAREWTAFVTISEEDRERRASLATAAEVASDKAPALALLADVDFRLGLLREAQEEFLAALNLKPHDTTIQHALELVQTALGDAKTLQQSQKGN